jgi:hypothetical protein
MNVMCMCCMQGLTEMGLTKVAPSNGAFYIYVDTSDAVPDSVSHTSILHSAYYACYCSAYCKV